MFPTLFLIIARLLSVVLQFLFITSQQRDKKTYHFFNYIVILWEYGGKNRYFIYNKERMVNTMGEVKILLSPEEHEKVKEKADARGMSMRAYVKNAALQRRDKKTGSDIIMSLDALRVLEENKQVLESLDKRLTSLFYYSEDDGPLTIYTELLIEADLSFRKLERKMTNLIMLLSGGD